MADDKSTKKARKAPAKKAPAKKAATKKAPAKKAATKKASAKKAATKKAATKKAPAKKAATKKAATKKAAAKKAPTKKAPAKKPSTKKAATKEAVPRHAAAKSSAWVPDKPPTPKGPAVVLGGGSWGTGLAHILGTHGYDTLLWMRNGDRVAELNERHTNARYLGDAPVDPRVRGTLDLQEAAEHAPVIIVAIPSKAFRRVAYALGDFVRGDQILLSATKGLEAGTLSRMCQVLTEETCCRKVGALSGPNLAREVLAGHPSATVVASPFEEVIAKADELLAGPRFRLYGNFDVVGVEMAGALKNIYAIAGGIAAGMGFGANTLSALITRGLAEICRIGLYFGAERTTFQGLAGVGDLVATCTSTLSRNHTVGRHLARGEKLDDIVANLGMVAEGVNTTRVVHSFALTKDIDMPIAHAVHRVLFEGATPAAALMTLMERESRYEDVDTTIRGRHLSFESFTERADDAHAKGLC